MSRHAEKVQRRPNKPLENHMSTTLLNILRWMGDERLLQAWVATLPTVMLLGFIVVCLIALCKGADWLIDGAVNLARRTGMPRIVIGATIVSLGTTTPEAVVSVMAAWMGNPGLALDSGRGGNPAGRPGPGGLDRIS